MIFLSVDVIKVNGLRSRSTHLSKIKVLQLSSFIKLKLIIIEFRFKRSVELISFFWCSIIILRSCFEPVTSQSPWHSLAPLKTVL